MNYSHFIRAGAGATWPKRLHIWVILFIFIFLFIASVHEAMAGSQDTLAIKAELRKLDKADQDWPSKESAARELISKSNEAGYVEGSLHASYILATSLFFRQKYQKSFQVLDSMLILLNSGAKNLPAGKTLEDKRSRIYSFMGMIFDEIGDYNKAMEYYLQSLRIVEAEGDDYEKAVLFKNLGMTNLAVGNSEMADDYFTKALEICRRIKDSKTEFDIYNALQSYYADSAKYETALQYGLKLLEIARDDSDSYSMALADNALGHIYLAWGKGILAEGFLREAMAISGKNHYETIMAQVLTGLASLKLSANDLKEANDLSVQALELAEKNDILSLKSQAALTLAEVSEKLPDYKNALKYYRLYESYRETENKNKNARAVLELQTKFEMDKINQEKKLLEDRLLFKQLQVSKRNYVISATVIILALLLVFLMVLVRRYKHVQALNRRLREQQTIINEQEKKLHQERENLLQAEIEHKNRELTSIAMTLTQENEFKQHLVEGLENLKVTLGPSKKQEIRQVNGIVNTIRQNISNSSWEEFRTYFDNVYSTFYSNLNERFPFLSQSEKKLCAMLKLGLSTKEISMLTYREVKSVESARNRLRKKMNLDPKTNLLTFLAEF